jgi:sugar lactone lactonase YvrE
MMIVKNLAASLLLTMNMTSFAAEPAKLELPQFTPAWTLSEGLDTPESVVYDAKNKRLYVSNVQGNPPEKDGKGYISIVSLEGKTINKIWVKDLNAPKGMAVVGDMLYVADIDTLLAININEGKVSQRYPAAGSQFLNDVTADKNDNVYVSDMFTNSIWCLCKGKFEMWLNDAALESPNGLFAEDKRLVVGTWGIRTEGFTTSRLGYLKAVSLSDKKISIISDRPVGNLDGVMSDGAQGYFATDWMAGKLFYFDPAGKAHETLKLGQGSADASYLAEKKLLLVPMMKENKLMAFKKN